MMGTVAYKTGRFVGKAVATAKKVATWATKNNANWKKDHGQTTKSKKKKQTKSKSYSSSGNFDPFGDDQFTDPFSGDDRFNPPF